MCGFVTIAQYAAGTAIDARHVDTLRDTLKHRGPDDATTEIVDHWVALGHRRLSIIDVDGARQPLRNEDGQVVCIFNGEIYNFVDLRTRLRALGHVFTTAGDGEVVVHGYEEWGDAVFDKLEGMFAVALVDRRRRRAVLVRDRFGIKPLFYRVENGRVVAASEIKPLIADGVPSASRSGLAIGALRMHVPWPLTAFDGIFRMPPGALLDITHGQTPRLVRICSTASRSMARRTNPDEALETLLAAVRRQMVADVPVGAFLSGGIDSTLIVSLMRDLTNADIHTFSIQTGVEDESRVAAETARILETKHHTIRMDELSFDDLAELAELYDEPFAETSALGVRALSRFAREHVKVALSGDGGDEVFGGYASYRWIQLSHMLPGLPRRWMGPIVHQLLTERVWSAPARRILRGLLLATEPPALAQRDTATIAWAARGQLRESSETLSEAIETASGADVSRLDAAGHAMLADRLERLPNAMLHKVDIASMSASLEVRVPMLDDALVRYADAIDTRDLLGFRYGKRILRRVLERLPAGRVAWEKKRGFTLPLEQWIGSPTNAPRFEELFMAHRETLLELTATDVPALWKAFERDESRYSRGTTAMLLLWYASVALWADRYGVRTAVERSVAEAPVI